MYNSGSSFGMSFKFGLSTTQDIELNNRRITIFVAND